MIERKTEDVLRDNAMAAEASSKRKKKKKMPQVSYGMDGKRIKGEMKKWKKSLLWCFSILVFLVVIIYVPPMFYSESTQESYRALTADASALKTYQQFVKDNPDADFDGDGLLNSEETDYGTNIWNVDTDNDGVYDSAELTITNTSPTSPSAVQIDLVKAEDSKAGATISTPYKVDDIIFWPDDYQSKAYGAVVRTLHGYRFWNFSGYVKFPTRVYAYEYADGVHKALPYREAEDAYRIDTHNEVRTYDEELIFTNELSLPFLGSIYLEDGGFGNFLSNILPDKGGILTCQHKAVLDTEPDTSTDVTAPLSLPHMDFSDLARFGENQNTLKDLSSVRKQIEAGYCVAASIYSDNTGETIAIIYGYDVDGNLLVADTNLNPAGKLTITECAKKVINQEGVLGQMSWFEFSGFGFNSYRYKDRINFFASTITSVEDSKEEVLETEPETESDTEAMTEEPETTSESLPPETDISTVVQDETIETESLPEEKSEEQSEEQSEISAESEIKESESEIKGNESETEKKEGSMMTFSLN